VSVQVQVANPPEKEYLSPGTKKEQEEKDGKKKRNAALSGQATLQEASLSKGGKKEDEEGKKKRDAAYLSASGQPLRFRVLVLAFFFFKAAYSM
jgi:hypothetical protein